MTKPDDTGSDSSTRPINPYPLMAPRFWHGMRPWHWWKLLFANKFRLATPKIHIAVGVSLITPANELLALLQGVLFGRKIRQTKIEQSPIFILGHWRSGTTLLHELLVQHPNFASPNTYQCFAPSHFLLSEWPMTTFGAFLLPKQRPMDNMEAGWKLPQEDEFALMNLGVPTPYLRIAFPQTQDKLLQYLTLEDLSEEERKTWRDGFLWFLKVLTYHFAGKRLVLKSPTHTGRLGILHEMFPNAKFIHLTRDPVKLYPSTLRLWKSLEEVQSLQSSAPKSEMEDYVLECQRRMYSTLPKIATRLPRNQFAQIRYEDLAANPFDTVANLFEQLELTDFDQIKAPLRERLANHAAYQPNVHTTDLAIQQKVHEAWPQYCRDYGYLEKA